MSEVKGTVEAISTKYGKFSVLVNDNWYGTKEEYKPRFKIDRGDEIVFDDGGKKYLSKVRRVGGDSTSASPSGTGGSRTPGFPVGVDTKDRSIVRQNSLNHAVNLVCTLIGQQDAKTADAREKQLETVANMAVGVARIFEGYSSGDDDAAEAKAMMENTEE